MSFRAADHQLIRSIAFVEEDPAERVTESILCSRGVSASYLIASGDGDVAVNVGGTEEGARHRERYEEMLGRALDVRAIVLTQDHQDHWGGWGAFAGEGVETVVQRQFPQDLKDRQRLGPFFLPRVGRALNALRTETQRRRMLLDTPVLEVTTLVDDSYTFEVAGRSVEVFALPGGETRNGLGVWLPGERAVFIGNLAGALYGQFPHLNTIRGDRQRSARTFIESVERVLAFEPEILLTGHDEVIRGQARIRADLGKVRDMVEYVLERTLDGMSEGKDLWTLEREIELPAALEPAPGRGPIRWYVRSILEEYAGTFRMESTTELYDVAPSAVWPDFVELAGGVEALAARAAAYVRDGRPVEALHLTDAARAVAPADPAVLDAEIAALELLHERTGGTPFDEMCWLEGEIERARTTRASGANDQSTP